MKQVYIKPSTEIIEAEVIQVVCASPLYTLNRYSRWGNDTSNDQEVNQWVNEGQGKGTLVGRYEAVQMGGDDYDDLESCANGGYWE